MSITENPTTDRTGRRPEPASDYVPPPRNAPGQARRLYHQLQLFLHRNGLAALRITLGAVYVWFGALKVSGSTPVAALVEATSPWPDPSWFVPAMGAFEMLLGLWMIVGRKLWLALPGFVAHLIGTFGVLVMVPQVAFQNGNPLLLTVEGEFVVKNAVMLAAIVVVVTKTGLRRRTVGFGQ